MSSSFLKDPTAVLDYLIDWSGWLAVAETITSHTVTATGVTVDSHTATTTAVTVWLSGGTSGTRGTIACHITTSAGRQDVRTITVDATDR